MRAFLALASLAGLWLLVILLAVPRAGGQEPLPTPRGQLGGPEQLDATAPPGAPPLPTQPAPSPTPAATATPSATATPTPCATPPPATPAGSPVVVGTPAADGAAATPARC